MLVRSPLLKTVSTRGSHGIAAVGDRAAHQAECNRVTNPSEPSRLHVADQRSLSGYVTHASQDSLQSVAQQARANSVAMKPL
jgi:hypothetical protein